MTVPFKPHGQPFFLFTFRFVFTVLICYIAILGLAAVAKADADVVGALTGVKGGITIDRPGHGRVAKVTAGTELRAGDVLTAGQDAQAQLALTDSTKIYIAPQASVRVNHYSYTPDNNKRKAFIKVISGKARFIGNRQMSRDSAFIVETQSAAISTNRPFDFVINAAPDATEVLSLFASVRVKNASYLIVGTIDLAENFMTSVAPNRPPSQPVVMKARQRKEYIREVR